MKSSNRSSFVTLFKHSKSVEGVISVPGSKSLTNRALILASVANGQSTLSNVLISDDTEVMIKGLRQMGVSISFVEPNKILVNSNGKLSEPKQPIFLGNAGTATRFLTAMSCLVKGEVIIDGDEYMRTRPILPLVNALKSIGIDIQSDTGCPPVTIKSKGVLSSSEVTIDANLSSQYVSALLMLSPFNLKEFKIILKDSNIGGKGYIDLTLNIMKEFGITIETIENGWLIKKQSYKATNYFIEPDSSSATYIWAIEKLTNGKIDIGFEAKKMTQPDAKVYDLINSFPNFPDLIDGSQFQDAIPTLAVMAAFSKKKVLFTGIENLRVKECDRIKAIKEGLCKIHPELAIEIGDQLLVNGEIDIYNIKNLNVLIDSYDDHRIAMSFSLAGILIDGISISNYNCVSKTYPSYWKSLQSLGIQMNFT